MAKGKKTGGRNFEKGVSPNPKGRPAMPDALKKLQKNSRQVIIENMCGLVFKPVYEVEAIAEANSSSSIAALMASVLAKGIKMGCPTRAQFFMNYMVGKPLDFDPNDLDQEAEMIEGAIQAMPSSVLTKALQDYRESLKEPVS